MFIWHFLLYFPVFEADIHETGIEYTKKKSREDFVGYTNFKGHTLLRLTKVKRVIPLRATKSMRRDRVNWACEQGTGSETHKNLWNYVGWS